ncbi:MAG: TonB-dependent receptor [Robiginitomaculum sp.]|nr:MAG: TonB-dependent receptor [Robiginitomaculum sp.]
MAGKKDNKMKNMNRYMVGVCATSLISFACASTSAFAQTNSDDNKQSLALDAVIVSAGEPKIAIETPVSVSVIDQEGIESTQAATVGELIGNMPGVNMSGGVSALGQGFNIRGVGTSVGDSASDIIVRVDGVDKFFEAYRIGSSFAEPDIYKRVEVLKGPAAATLIGNGAIGGVISFTTKDPRDFLKGDDRAALRVKGQYDSNSEGIAASMIGAKLLSDNFGVLGMVTAREAEHYTDGDGAEVLPSEIVSKSYLVKGVYNFDGDEDHSLKLSYNKWLSDNTSYYDQQAGAFPSLVHRDVNDDTFLIAYNNGFSGNNFFDFETQISYALSNVDQTENTFAPTGLGLESTYRYASWQGRIQNTSEFASGDLWTTYLTYGIQGDTQERTNPRVKPDGSTQDGTTSHPDGDTQKIGVYAQTEIIYSDKLTIIPGVRYDTSKFEPGNGVPTLETSTVSGFSPKIAAMFNFTDSLGIFGSYTHAVRLPVLDEVFSFSRASSRGAARAPNLNLDPEESDNIEMGATLSMNDTLRKNDVFRAKLTYFKNDITNQISRASAGSLAYINIGEAEYNGFEIEGEYTSGRFFSRAAFSTTHGENALTGDFINTVPADQIDLTIGYALPNTRFNFGASTRIAFDQNDVSGSFSTSTEGYTILNVFASWKPDTILDGLEVRARIENFTDKTYRTHLSNLNAKGRTFRLSLAKTF